MKAKVWLISWLVIVESALSVIWFGVQKIDPYFHFHKPLLDKYFYTLNNERSQNDGIIKQFDYDALITGTSMTENFRSSEMDRLFGTHSIKVAFAGGSFKEINDNVLTALEHNPNVKTVIRCLDMSKFPDTVDAMRTDSGKFPTYLYDENPFNDVEYFWNRDVAFGRAYQMAVDRKKEGFNPGITSFDDYSRWQESYKFGPNTVCPDGIVTENVEQSHLTDEEKKTIEQNIVTNVTSIADQYPDVDFYYFYSPYSVVEWNNWKNKGILYKQLEEEEFITELILPHKNIHLFSFNNRTDITTEINNYKDSTHYGCWINSLILKWLHDGEYQLTEENYKDYLKQEYDFYTKFDYAGLNVQIDYENDFYAGALVNRELTGAEPLDVLVDKKEEVSISGAEYKYDADNRPIVDCRGSLARESGSKGLAQYLRDRDFIGIKFGVDLDDGYNYLTFDGQKIADHGRLTAYVYDSNGKAVRQLEVNYPNLDNEVHQYVIDLSGVDGKVTVVLNGGYIDSTGSAESEYQFSNVYMY